jgi:hypothetical protein
MYNARWMACRRKVKKFLTAANVSSQGGHHEGNEQLADDAETPMCTDTLVGPFVAVCHSSGNVEGPQPQLLRCSSSPTKSQADSETACDEWKKIDDAEMEYISSDSDSDEVFNESRSINARQFLAKWMAEFQVTQAALNELLKFLRQIGVDVPKCAATLMKTPRNTTVVERSGGQYVYMGIEKSLAPRLSTLSDRNLQNITALEVKVNIDGLPLFKSSHLSVWPILCSVSGDVQITPFCVAIYSGLKKPNDLEFLREFLAEAKGLIADGFNINGVHVRVRLSCIVCDAPAKAFVKGIIQFNGKYGCDRCVQKGTYSDGRMLFLHSDAELRTDESFRKQENKKHHKNYSPFCDLPIDMINDFPVDYMHQVNLGVTKRLLLAWICGPPIARLDTVKIATISSKLSDIRSCMPRDFARRPRSLEYVRLWKATEFRQFLLYTGPIVLKDILDKDKYIHFLSLSCGIALLINESTAVQYNDFAKQLLKFFVDKSIDLYGKNFVTYNVHSMVHLGEVALRYGCLDNCSAYPFENYMQVLKRCVRSTKNPIVQIVHRLRESELITGQTTVGLAEATVDVRAAYPDNCFLLSNGKYCLCRELVSNNSEVLCEVYNRTYSWFSKDLPCDSRLRGINRVTLTNHQMKKFPVRDIVGKAVFVRMNDGTAVIIRLLHSS